MHRSKGKWVVSNKDTWWTGSLLSPVILAYLTKFRQVAENAKGVPMMYVEKQAQIQGVDAYSDDVDLEAARKLRLADIEELMYIFNEDNKPKIEKYNFELEWIETGREAREISGTFHCTNQVEYDKYVEDETVWYKRQEAGFKLFGEIYQTLDD